MKKIVYVLTWCSGILVFILLAGSLEALERMPVERLDLQAKLLRAVRKFSSRQLDQLVVGVIYVEEAKEIAQNFAAELEKLTHNDQPIQVVFIAANTLDSATDSVNIVYVTERAGIHHFPKQTDSPQNFDPKNGIIVALYPIPSPIDSDVGIGTF